MSSSRRILIQPNHQHSSKGLLAQLHQVRVKARTVLAIDLLLHERTIDLDAVTEVLSCDPGAMMCALGLLAEDSSDDSPISVRIADWISNLDLHELLVELAAHLEFGQESIGLSRMTSEA